MVLIVVLVSVGVVNVTETMLQLSVADVEIEVDDEGEINAAVVVTLAAGTEPSETLIVSLLVSNLLALHITIAIFIFTLRLAFSTSLPLAVATSRHSLFWPKKESNFRCAESGGASNFIFFGFDFGGIIETICNTVNY